MLWKIKCHNINNVTNIDL